MKRHLLLVTLLLVFGLIPHAQATPLFDVIDATYHISGRVGYRVDGEQHYNEYDFTSSHAISGMVNVDQSDIPGSDNSVVEVNGSAKAGFLYSEILDEYGGTGWTAKTEAWSETIFNPLFSGSGPILSFYSTFDYPNRYEIGITDNTLGVEIFNPEADFDFTGDWRDLNNFTFYYDNWNIDHTYTLWMRFQGGSNAEGHHIYEMGTNFPIHARVPEPPAGLLFGTVMIGLIFKRVRSKNRLSGYSR